MFAPNPIKDRKKRFRSLVREVFIAIIVFFLFEAIPSLFGGNFEEVLPVVGKFSVFILFAVLPLFIDCWRRLNIYLLMVLAYCSWLSGMFVVNSLLCGKMDLLIILLIALIAPPIYFYDRKRQLKEEDETESLSEKED